jgi:starvation-inducible DNA-binding protein
MATTTRPDVNRTVGALARELSKENSAESPVVQNLRKQVANAILLYLNYKHYHWQTYGPLFRDLHKLFDQLAEEVLESVDPLAERVRMIGQDPPAHPVEAMKLASVVRAEPHATMREMAEEADRNQLIVIKEMRQAVKVADEHDDPGTVDLLSKCVQIHEKHEWWMRDLLRKGDGLAN